MENEENGSLEIRNRGDYQKEYRKGYRQGMREGRQQEKRDTIIRLWDIGISDVDILADASDCTLGYVLDILGTVIKKEKADTNKPAES